MDQPKYLLWLGASVAVSFLFFLFTGRRNRNNARLVLVSVIPAVILGAVCSKLLYLLLQLDFVLVEGIEEHLFSMSPERFSFIGGVAGVCLSVALCGKLTRTGAVNALNGFAPAGLLLAALIRFGEFFLAGDYMTGTGPFLEEGSPLCFFPMAINCSGDPEWAEWYLAVFAIEGTVLLVMAVVSLRCFRRDRFLRSLFYLCLPQIILENLLNNVFWWIFCVRVEQALYMAAMLILLIVYTVRAKGWRFRAVPAVAAVLCTGLFVVMEFAMEQKIEFLSFLSVEACYGLMGLGTAVLLAAEVWSHPQTVR